LSRPRVLWLGVERHPALELLANDVERALGDFGFAPELRPFSPHLTVGRAKKDARPAGFRGLDTLARRVEYAATIPVEHVDLMQSILGPSGPSYRVAHRADLRLER
jgi:2'-5' RNA ligase